MSQRAWVVALVLGGMPAPAAHSAEDPGPGNGLIPAKVQVCLGCHAQRHGERATGAPPLAAIWGQPTGVPGVTPIKWDDRSLNRWLANPRALAPETDCRFPGFADDEARETVVRYLRQAR